MLINTKFYALYLEYQDCLLYNKMLKFIKEESYKPYHELKTVKYKDCNKIKPKIFS